MKNVFFIIVLILSSFFTTAQTTNVEMEQEKSKATLSNFKVMLHFEDIADLKRFRTKEFEDMKILDKIAIEPDFSFGFTVKKTALIEEDTEEEFGVKVEIKDIDNKEELFKDIKDAMDGIIEVYEEY